MSMIEFAILDYGNAYRNQIEILDVISTESDEAVYPIAKRKYGEQIWIRPISKTEAKNERYIGFPHPYKPRLGLQTRSSELYFGTL